MKFELKFYAGRTKSYYENDKNVFADPNDQEAVPLKLVNTFRCALCSKIYQNTQQEYAKDFTNVIFISEPGNVEFFVTRASELADVHLGNKEYDNAIRIYTKAVRLSLAELNNYSLCAKIRRRDTEDVDEEDAIKNILERISVMSNISRFYAARGNAYYHKEKYGNAIRDYTHALAFVGRVMLLYCDISKLYIDKDEDDNAKKYLKKCSDLAEKCIDCSSQIASAHEKQGEKTLADKNWEFAETIKTLLLSIDDEDVEWNAD